VPALMPAGRTGLQYGVIIVLRLFDQAFQADVPADFKAVVIEGEYGEQTRHATVAVAEGMYAKVIENQTGNGDQRRYMLLIEGVVVEETKLLHGRRRGSHGNGTEPETRSFADPEVNDVVLDAFPLARIASPFLDRAVQLPRVIRSDRQIGGVRVNALECVPVALDLLFRAVLTGRGCRRP
jgi:hypothetical protein